MSKTRYKQVIQDRLAGSRNTPRILHYPRTRSLSPSTEEAGDGDGQDRGLRCLALRGPIRLSEPVVRFKHHSFLLEEPSLFRQTSKLAAKEEALRTLGHALLYFHTDLFFEFVHRHEQAYAFEAGTHSRLDRDHFISERLEFAAQRVLGTVMGDTFPNRKNGLQI